MRRSEIIAHCEAMAPLSLQSVSCDRAPTNRAFFGGKSLAYAQIAMALKDPTTGSVSEYVNTLERVNTDYRDGCDDDLWHYFNGFIDACRELRKVW